VGIKLVTPGQTVVYAIKSPVLNSGYNLSAGSAADPPHTRYSGNGCRQTGPPSERRPCHGQFVQEQRQDAW
jgi:hypothetical protein